MTENRIQYIALFLIVLAAFGIAVGEQHGWVHLVDFCNMFGGGGVGILTGQKLGQITNKDGGQTTFNPPTQT